MRAASRSLPQIGAEGLQIRGQLVGHCLLFRHARMAGCGRRVARVQEVLYAVVAFVVDRMAHLVDRAIPGRVVDEHGGGEHDQRMRIFSAQRVHEIDVPGPPMRGFLDRKSVV